MKTVLLSVLLLGSIALSYAALPSLVGNWKGTERAKHNEGVWLFTFTADTTNVSAPHLHDHYAASYNTSAGPDSYHNFIDFVFSGGQYQGQTGLGIYKVTRDHNMALLQLAVAQPNSGNRPTGYNPMEEAGIRSWSAHTSGK